ncbi:MAG: PspC domain-containing protein [Anaerosomatales bacterium]|nr:PspC domain-containing protein [Anaerosomatales bacterium]
MAGKLYRSRADRMIAGVCGGLAEHFGWDPVLVRLAAVALLFVTNGAAGIAYLVMAAVVPEAPAEAASGPIVPPAAGETAGEASVEAPVAEGQGETSQPQASQPGPPPAPAQADGARPRRGAVWVGAVLVVLGIALLADQVFGMPVWRLWPAFIILYGLGMIVRAVRS